MRQGDKKTRLTVRMSEELMAKVIKLAEGNNCNSAELVRQAIDFYLKAKGQ
ncbi:CopG family transcriptional regulator [Calothrix membranacea FACHB-236]|nr:CopG family transcriptional regulator [Calothrix membranacea FACHB-236]